MESLDSGSWESIILETPDGTCRLYVVQTTMKDTQPQMQTTSRANNGKNANKEPLRVITRAQSKLARENAPRERTTETKQK